MLDSLREAVVPNDLACEFIVVDNNSDDDTRQVLEETEQPYKSLVKYVFEHKSGLSYARNRGVREARGEIIAFTDDDVIVDKQWIQNIYRAFKEHDDAACVGGKILPIWETPEPKWLKSKWHSYLALLNHGDCAAYMEQPVLWGANIAFKSEIFKKYGLFDPNLGRRPGKLYSHEETEFLHRLNNSGEKLLYYPFAIVYHHVPAHRMSKKYLRKWRFDHGELQGILTGDAKYLNSTTFHPASSERMLALILVNLMKIGCFTNKRFDHELRICESIGFLSGRMKRKILNQGFKASCFLV